MPVEVKKDDSWHVRLTSGKGAQESLILVSGSKGNEYCSVRIIGGGLAVDATLERISVRDLEELGRKSLAESGLERVRGKRET